MSSVIGCRSYTSSYTLGKTPNPIIHKKQQREIYILQALPRISSQLTHFLYRSILTCNTYCNEVSCWLMKSPSYHKVGKGFCVNYRITKTKHMLDKGALSKTKPFYEIKNVAWWKKICIKG